MEKATELQLLFVVNWKHFCFILPMDTLMIVLWCTLSLPVGGAVPIPQLQLELSDSPEGSLWSDCHVCESSTIYIHFGPRSLRSFFWGPNWPRTEVTEDWSGWVTSVRRTELHIRRTDLHLVILHAKCFEIDDCGRRGHSQKHYKRRSRLHDRKFLFANRVVNKFCYLRFVLIVPSVLRHWWRW